MGYFKAAKELLEWALLCGETEQEWVEFSPLWPVEAARINDKRPAYVKTHVPDGWVKNIKGEDDSDVYFLVRIKQEANQKFSALQSAPEYLRGALCTSRSGNIHTQGGNETPVADVVE